MLPTALDLNRRIADLPLAPQKTGSVLIDRYGVSIMAPDPITSAAITKAVEGLSGTATDFAGKALDLPSGQIGGLIADNIGYQRWKNAIRLIERAAKFSKQRGIEPNTVPLKVFVPILEGCSLEDEDDAMVSRWASLLANAADSTVPPVSPAYPELLKQIGRDEALLLDDVYRHQAGLMPRRAWQEYGQAWDSVKARFDADEIRAVVAIENLLRLGLLGRPGVALDKERKLVVMKTNHPTRDDEGAVHLTYLGYAFVSACREPQEVLVPPSRLVVGDEEYDFG